MMEAEIGVMLPQTKELWGLPEAGRDSKDSPREPSKRAWPCKHLDIKILASRTLRIISAIKNIIAYPYGGILCDNLKICSQYWMA